jgi:hypothetical protein
MSHEAITNIIGLATDRDLVFAFFAAYSRFEYALKRSGFLKAQDKAQPDWDKFASASVEGEKLYIGDGAVAIDLVAHPSQGIFLQGVKYHQGDKFAKGGSIKVRPGHKKATDLKPGEVYVVLPGVSFELPKE